MILLHISEKSCTFARFLCAKDENSAGYHSSWRGDVAAECGGDLPQRPLVSFATYP